MGLVVYQVGPLGTDRGTVVKCHSKTEFGTFEWGFGPALAAVGQSSDRPGELAAEEVTLVLTIKPQ